MCVYLEAIENITSSYLNKSLKPLERIYRIWHSTFMLRIWRHNIMREDSYNLEHNFVSSNSYNCLEILAHSLILASIALREDNSPELFLPWLWTSQACESYFRAARSFTSAESTQINFSLKEFLVSRCPKIDASIHISAKGAEDGIDYSRQRKSFHSEDEDVYIPKELPTDYEIEKEIMKARDDADNCLRALGN